MNYSYEEILGRIEDRYEQISGEQPDSLSDCGIRLRMLAAELYSLIGSIEWIKKQMLPDTATGEQLDLFAAQRGLSRISGSRATGRISFRLDTPVEYDLLIPAGTICTTSDGGLNYVVAEDLTLYQGDSFVFGTAYAQHSGKAYNIDAGRLTTIVTYFSAGLRIDNSSGFRGGTDDEDDESLRKRIIASYGNISNGVNEAYYKKLALSVPGVYSASASRDNVSTPIIRIYVAGQGGTVPADVLSQVQALVSENRCAGISAVAADANISQVNVTLKISPAQGVSYDTAKDNAEAAVRSFFGQLKLGDPLILAELGSAIINAPGVANYTFENMTDLTIGSSAIFVLGSLSVSQMS